MSFLTPAEKKIRDKAVDKCFKSLKVRLEKTALNPLYLAGFQHGMQVERKSLSAILGKMSKEQMEYLKYILAEYEKDRKKYKKKK